MLKLLSAEAGRISKRMTSYPKSYEDVAEKAEGGGEKGIMPRDFSWQGCNLCRALNCSSALILVHTNASIKV